MIFIHGIRVSFFSYILARKLKLSCSDRKILFWASFFHDVGKLKIPRNILNKEDALTLKEFQIIKTHVYLGCCLLKKIGINEKIIIIISQHHERLDGSGYPSNLRENQIEFLSKILMVADVYDALTSNRPYRKKMKKQKAFELMENSCLDSYIVKVLKESLVDREILTKIKEINKIL